MLSLKDRVIIVSGAAGNLGRAVARAAPPLGARVVLVDRAPDRLQSLFPDLCASDRHMLATGVDAGSPEQAHSLVETVVARFGRVDGLVNAIGAFRGGATVDKESIETWDALMSANFRATLHACRAVAPVMRRQRGGRIVNVASRDGVAGRAGLGAYCVSKAAVIRLTETLADELKQVDVTSNCIMPGVLDTPDNRARTPDADFSTWVDPSDAASVALFLLSDGARAVTGAVVPVSGRG